MLIGILQTGHVAEPLRAVHGEYSDMFQRLLAGHGFTFRTWNVVDMEFPDRPDDADGWLITGSRHGAYDDLPFIAPLEVFIRAAQAARVPMVGICFGHQIIAQALGGKVEPFPGGWSVGATDYMLAGQPVTLNAWHRDQVVALPEGARMLGESASCRYGALTIGERTLTVQAHPEFDAGVIAGLIEHRSDAVPRPLIAAARERLSVPTDNAVVARMIAEFFLKQHEAVDAG